MLLKQAVNDYISNNLDKLHRDYRWTFDSGSLPLNICPVGDNWFDKNISLRALLHKAWLNGSQAERALISNWYIVQWGGVRTNHKKTLEYYAIANPTLLLSLKEKGIASWSKSISVVEPDRYAIFDARVSSAINSLQIIYEVDNPKMFPILPSRNGVIKIANERLKKLHWQKQDKKIFYQSNNNMLIDIVANLGGKVTLQMAEMVLFSRAEILANQWP